MAVARRFLIASSLTRLIRKERGSERVVEGHFPAQGGRQSHIRVERGQCHLVLTSLDDVNAADDWTEVPRSHAEALLDVCPGTLTFERSRVRLPNHEVLIDRFITPGPLDVVTVEFPSQIDADTFLPPVWFGPEVTQDENFTNRVMAIVGRPRAPEAPLSNAALETVLDLLEGGSDHMFYASEEQPAEPPAEDGPFERLRRLAAVRPASPVFPVAPAEPAAEEKAEEDKPADSIAPFRRRRPTLQAAPKPEENGDERLAGVIQGLSEALAQASEKDERFGS